jgi:hypothetical protein
MVLFSLEEEIRHFRGDTSTPRCYEFFTVGLKQLLDEKLVFERDPKNASEFRLKGRSNLYPKLLQEQCDNGCLNVPAVVNHYQELRALVDQRNGIAHGRKVIIDDLAKYKPYEDAAVAAMHELAYAIITALTERKYLEPVPEFHL